MKVQQQPIPIYSFSPDDDLGKLPLRHVSLEVRNDYDFSEAHRHNYYEVFFFHKGGGRHIIDFGTHEIPDNSVHIVGPGQVHLLKRMPESHGAVVHFSKETAIHLETVYPLLQSTASPIIQHSKEDFQTIKILLALLEAELVHDPLTETTATACLNLLLLKSISPKGAAERQTGNTVLHHFSNFRQLAEINFRQHKLPGWYATQLHITEKRLNEICKAAMGTTAGQYLKDRVLLEAKRLIGHSEGSIKEIGYHLGFDDPAYFTRFFRKSEGITAGDFRNKYK